MPLSLSYSGARGIWAKLTFSLNINRQNIDLLKKVRILVFQLWHYLFEKLNNPKICNSEEQRKWSELTFIAIVKLFNLTWTRIPGTTDYTDFHRMGYVGL